VHMMLSGWWSRGEQLVENLWVLKTSISLFRLEIMLKSSIVTNPMGGGD
jgi:hypothetical protein